MENSNDIGLISANFQKTFDCLDHKILLEKMSCLGYKSAVTDWTYLCHSHTYVTIDFWSVLKNNTQNLIN